MKSKNSALGAGLIILAAVFWGLMGLFVRHLAQYGFTAIQIVSMRLTVAAVIFALILLIKEPASFRVSPKDIPLFLGLGLGSVLFFTICYFTSIEIMPLSTAAILLYTSPIWVMLMSVVFFREKLSPIKLAALVLAFGGCVLVSGFSGGGLSAVGLLIGLGAGLGYGLYSILGTVALRRYSPYTVTACTFIIAAVGSWFVSRPGELLSTLSSAPSPVSLIFFILLTGLVTAVIPFLAYTLGLQQMEASKAAILATVEPMVATLIGAAVFDEPVSLQSALGIALILCAVIILNLKIKKNASLPHSEVTPKS